MSSAEPNRRYLAYLSALALAVTPVVLPVAAATAAAAPSAGASVEKLTALRGAAAKIAADPGYSPARFTECFLGPGDKLICLG
ncbi:hypothetical protein [Actinophytocola sp. KF-1]